MLFRRTKVANGLDGKSCYTYRLVENQREDTKIRQKTVLNLGANRDVPQSDWKAVAQRVETIQHGQISCFEYPKRIESATQSVVNRLRARDLNGDKLGTGSVVTVDLDTMKHTDVRSVGCERLCLQALEDLQLGRILDELGMSEPDTRRALALVAAKMIHPASERETSRWIKDNSSLPELLGLTRSRDLERKTLYRIGDCLWKRQAEIEKHLFRRERDLLNIPATIVFYDLSNTVNRHSTVTHYQRPNMTHSQEGGTGGEVSEILFFSAKSKRRPSLIYSMQIIPVCLSIVARRKGVSATRRGGLNWTPISLLVGHPCKLFHTQPAKHLGIDRSTAYKGIRNMM